MIVTVTPNPSIDRTLVVDEFREGGVNRALDTHVEPSGKGVNVTRALLTNGVASIAVLPLGGSEGDQLASLLKAERVPFVPVPIARPVRVNISLVRTSGTSTKINERGPLLSREEVADLMLTVVGLVDEAAWVVASGSLPQGVEPGFYAELAARVHEAGARYALDTSGLALRLGAAMGPDLLKPNVDELAEVVDKPIRTFGEVVAAAADLRHEKTDVLVSLGPDGALLVTGQGALHAEAPVGQPRNTIGAGDNLLAGFLAVAHTNPEVALREAVAWGSAAVRAPGSLAQAVTDADRGAVKLGAVDLERELQHPSVS
jgi:1-phosphofructokinase